MKRLTVNISLVFSVLIIIFSVPCCKKTENPIKFPKGIFPDTIIALSDINSPFDDYNMALFMLNGDIPVIFSSNRGSSGEQFDLVQGIISFIFDQTDAGFCCTGQMTSNPFYSSIISKTVTSADELGPYAFFSPLDGFEYFLWSSENDGGDLDYFYMKHQPYFGSVLPAIEGPFPATLLNSSSEDVYICFDTNRDTAYFSSDREGKFNIYLKQRPSGMSIGTWLDLDFSPAVKADSINSTGNDKCPFVYRNMMVFASDREGGMGGTDLYYSLFRKGKWSSPVNLGPEINTPFNEYRPVLGSHQDFSNSYMIFSSDRPGGKGGFDLFFTGFNLPE